MTVTRPKFVYPRLREADTQNVSVGSKERCADVEGANRKHGRPSSAPWCFRSVLCAGPVRGVEEVRRGRMWTCGWAGVNGPTLEPGLGTPDLPGPPSLCFCSGSSGQVPVLSWSLVGGDGGFWFPVHLEVRVLPSAHAWAA